MFLGGADQEPEWRAEPFKGLFRWWWRIAQGRDLDMERLREAESHMFGFAGDKEQGKKSSVSLTLESACAPRGDSLNSSHRVHHPEVGQNPNGASISSLLYLAGMGLMTPECKPKHQYFPSGGRFRLTVTAPMARLQELKTTLALVQAFGTVGGRSRNGWGSFQTLSGAMEKSEAVGLIKKCEIDWKDACRKDYPHCLGKDEKGSLLWKTKEAESWHKAMHLLAEAYVKVRAETVPNGLPPINPGPRNSGNLSERHLLGIPLTNHSVDRPTRYASPLRFVVKRVQSSGEYKGFVLHVPQAFPQAPSHLNQIRVWELVHAKLDALLKRAQYGDCL
jgi:CRISPR-associated protein Cmr1